MEEDPLFGREAELEQLLTLLQGGPAEEGSRVLLHGMGGLGKTRLASAAAQRWLERLQAPEGDKVLWLEVGSGAAPEILGRIDAQLERRPHESRQAALARSGVSLVVLENAAGTYALQQTLAALPEELPALVTSRLRFPGLSRLELTRLSREAALELLEFHLTAGNENMGSAPPPHPEALCALLGDHPFALRLAARTLASAPDTSVIQALYAAPQDTIRVLLEQSLSTVSAREYEVYLALGSLEAPHSTPELLTYLLERPSEEIERALWELTGRGLLTREAHPGADAVTYRMHDLTWRVAREHRTHLPHHLRATTLQYAAAHTDRADLLAADLSHLLAAASSAPPDELKTLMAFWLGGQLYRS